MQSQFFSNKNDNLFLSRCADFGGIPCVIEKIKLSANFDLWNLFHFKIAKPTDLVDASGFQIQRPCKHQNEEGVFFTEILLPLWYIRTKSHTNSDICAMIAAGCGKYGLEKSLYPFYPISNFCFQKCGNRRKNNRFPFFAGTDNGVAVLSGWVPIQESGGVVIEGSTSEQLLLTVGIISLGLIAWCIQPVSVHRPCSICYGKFCC